MNHVTRRPAADRDLVAIFRYYAREAGIRVADRFFAQAEATFDRLADMPGIGAAYAPHEPLYAGLRYATVSRFRAYLVFYRPVPGGIEVFRVLHAARDLHALLAEEFGVDELAEGDGAADENE